MVSQLLSAAAAAELRHLRDERRGQSPSSLLRASAPAILRTSASGKASCSSGSAPICCLVSEHRGPAAITAARSQTGVLCCFLRAAASFDMPISRSYKQKASASKAATRVYAAEEVELGRLRLRSRVNHGCYVIKAHRRGRRWLWRRACGENGLYLVGAPTGALARARYIRQTRRLMSDYAVASFGPHS